MNKTILPEIKKSNLIISAITANSLVSHKLFLLALQRAKLLDPDDEFKNMPRNSVIDYSSGLVAEFTLTECRNILGLSKGGRQNTSLMEYVNTFLADDWALYIADRRFKEKIQLISGAFADLETKRIYIKFSEDEVVQNLLFYCKNNYTLESINTFMAFKSVFSFRIYEMALEMFGKAMSKNSCIDSVTFEMGMAELKFKLGVYNGIQKGGNHKATKIEEAKAARYLAEYPPNYIMAEKEYKVKAYPGYKALASGVLDIARREIEMYTPYTFDFSPVVEGGKNPTGIAITLTKKETSKAFCEEKKEAYSKEQIDAIDFVMDLFDSEYMLTYNDAVTLATKANFNTEIIESTYRVMEQTPFVKSVMGFMIRGIESGGYRQRTSVRKSPAVNFKQRDYDFVALERELLGL